MIKLTQENLNLLDLIFADEWDLVRSLDKNITNELMTLYKEWETKREEMHNGKNNSKNKGLVRDYHLHIAFGCLSQGTKSEFLDYLSTGKVVLHSIEPFNFKY
jgi:DUF438 domain-containing protein